ncbi:hypothetical protein BJ973_002227 [Actinoplanes tereljensis]|uniref:Uncharacterized protein n=1 Tax=Paractinoplanes tereljensis TaxID=571912 RepID=A0A919NPJ3_9ACTN|nr:DUF6325 family protein [Actinoplanes tereljensis]GIF21900.1 hypothetical protein Ate02nite_46300 [Actinoplanes tereljensis]
MALGPLELVVLCFPASRLNDGVLATLERLDSAPGVRVVDVLVVRTDAVGGACGVELSELPGLAVDPVAIVRLATGLITETDVDEVGALVDQQTDALAVLVEHLWVRDLADKVATIDGTLLTLLHIPAVQEVYAIAGT